MTRLRARVNRCGGRAPRRAACRRTRLWKWIIARWVWATIRFSSLRGSGISALRLAALLGPVPDARQVVPGLGARRAATAIVVPGLEVQPVGRVELRRPGVARPVAVQRVEVEPRRAALQQVGRADVLPEHHVGAVHGQVVVDELAEVGVAGGDVAAARRRPRPSRGASFL